MSSPANGPKRVVVELRFDVSRPPPPLVAGRALHQYWTLLAPHFRGVFLPPQWRADGTGVGWSWREPLASAAFAPADLSTVRKRLAGALRSFTDAVEDAPAGRESAREQVAGVHRLITATVDRLIAAPDDGLARHLVRTDSGLLLHSWGLATALSPSASDPSAASALKSSPSAKPASAAETEKNQRSRRRHLVASVALLLLLLLGGFLWRRSGDVSPITSTPAADGSTFASGGSTQQATGEAIAATNTESGRLFAPARSRREPASSPPTERNPSESFVRPDPSLPSATNGRPTAESGLPSNSSSPPNSNSSGSSPTGASASSPSSPATAATAAAPAVPASKASSPTSKAAGPPGPPTTATIAPSPPPAAPANHDPAPPKPNPPAPPPKPSRPPALRDDSAPPASVPPATSDQTAPGPDSPEDRSDPPRELPVLLVPPIVALDEPAVLPPTLAGDLTESTATQTGSVATSLETSPEAPAPPVATASPDPLDAPYPSQSVPLVDIARVRIQPWQLRLLRDSVVATRPVRKSEVPTVGALRSDLLNTRRSQVPAAFRAPIMSCGFVIDLGAAAFVGPLQWRDPDGSHPAKTTIAGMRAELSWIDSRSPARSIRELVDAQGRILARAGRDADGVATLATAANVRGWSWLALANAANGSGRYEWQVLQGEPSSPSWRTDADHARLDLFPAPGEFGSHQRTLALLDPATGWALVTELSLATEFQEK